jgi:glycosyltransferase involved in cell wall biosynthesis
MKKDLISLYVVFNKYRIDWLVECLKGVKNQTFDNLEYVFVVYGKDNDYKNIYKALSESELPFRLYDLPDTESFIDAIQYAWNKCKGEYVFRSDVDDIIMPNAILNQYIAIENEDASIIIPNYSTIEENGSHTIHDGKEKNLVCHALTEKDKLEYVKFLDGQTFRDGTKIIDTFKKYGFKISYLNSVSFIHRIHNKSLTYNENDVKIMDEKILKNG